LREWLEEHHPRLIGVWDWPRYRLLSRCLACDRLMALHTPWALYICERTPLGIVLTEQGRERVEQGRERVEAA
jgi:hypothetical protein